MTVQLIIKSAAQNVEDFKLDCKLSWTVAEVKDQITALYPTKPIREHQKLIYSGKLLPDHLPLSSVINQNQDVHTMHLVCPLPQNTDSRPTDIKKALSEPSPVSPADTQAIPNIQALNSGMPIIPSPYPDFQQYLMMQQVYAQFMAHYISQFNGQLPQNIPPSPIVQSVSRVTNQPAAVQNRDVPRRPAEENRDYIDYLYTFSRAVLLLAMLFHYSSPQRIMAVMMMFFLILIYRKVNRENQILDQQRAQQTTEVPADVQPSANEEQVPESSASTPAESHGWSSTIMTFVTLVSSFFSSLIPTDTAPVNIN